MDGNEAAHPQLIRARVDFLFKSGGKEEFFVSNQIQCENIVSFQLKGLASWKEVDRMMLWRMFKACACEEREAHERYMDA